MRSSSDAATASAGAAGSWLEHAPRSVLALLALGCIALGALMAGLTLGLMSLDQLSLRVLAMSPDEGEATAARAIIPVRNRGNQLLVTLLLTNTVANELLPLVLESLFPGGYVSLALSVFSVVLFGEIIPQATCSRYGLWIGARTIGFTRLLLKLFYPLAAPVAWLLDQALGDELRTGYDRERLKALISLHGPVGSNMEQFQDEEAGGAGRAAVAAASSSSALELALAGGGGGGGFGNGDSTAAGANDEVNDAQRANPTGGYGVLSADEATILAGTLDLSKKSVRDVMTPAEKVFCLSVDTRLDRACLKRILRRGHSRIPIYEHEKRNVVAIVLVKQLLLVDPSEALPVYAIIKRKKRSHKKKVASPVYVSQDCRLIDLINEFQLGRSHMAIVMDSLDKHETERKFLGIVTLEDIVEEIIMEDIIDETDVYIDNSETQPILVKGDDGRWHYSLPEQMLASRQRNPHLIRYRDIDERAYGALVWASGNEASGSDLDTDAAESGERRALLGAAPPEPPSRLPIVPPSSDKAPTPSSASSGLAEESAATAAASSQESNASSASPDAARPRVFIQRRGGAGTANSAAARRYHRRHRSSPTMAPGVPQPASTAQALPAAPAGSDDRECGGSGGAGASAARDADGAASADGTRAKWQPRDATRSYGAGDEMAHGATSPDSGSDSDSDDMQEFDFTKGAYVDRPRADEPQPG